VTRDRDRQSIHVHLGARGGGCGNVLLDTAAAIVAGILVRSGIALAAPVTAVFLDNATGSTGVDVKVKLEDPAEAPAATAVIEEHFGGEAGVDIVNVS
jgi:hypothetical protein